MTGKPYCDEPFDLVVTQAAINAYARACDMLVLNEADRLGLPGNPEEQAKELMRRGYGFKYPEQLAGHDIRLPEFCILPPHEKPCTCSASWDKAVDGMHADSCPRCLYPSGLPQARP